jgi:site-specific DNA recombinase
MRVGLYCRVSTEEQGERNTVDVQLETLRRLVPDGLEYIDNGVSGTIPLANRPAGAHLLADVRAKKVSEVVVYKLDRLGRSLRGILSAYDALDELGVSVRSAMEPFNTGTVFGKAMFGFLAVVAEWEHGAISERTMNGRERIVREGKWSGGPAPFGYCIIDSRLAPYDPEAGIVREIFSNIAHGGTLRSEAKRLNERGVFGRAGKPWTQGRLSKLVHCSTYTGQHLYRGKSGTLSRAVTPLVDRETWSLVHDQLRRNSVQQPTRRFNLLRGKIRCLNCGSTYIAAKRAGGKKIHYRCLLGMRPGPRHCRSANLNAVALEGYVWGQCLGLMDHPLQIEGFASDEIERLQEKDEHRAEEIQRLHRALAEQEAAKQRIISLVGLGTITDEDVKNALDNIKTEVGNIHAQLSALDASRSLAGEYIRRLRTAEALVIRIAKGVDQGIIDLKDDGHRRRVVDALLHSIEAKTIGDGRDRRVELTFRWLGQEPHRLDDWTELMNSPFDAEPPKIEPGVRTSQLSAVLMDATTFPTH